MFLFPNSIQDVRCNFAIQSFPKLHRTISIDAFGALMHSMVIHLRLVCYLSTSHFGNVQFRIQKNISMDSKLETGKLTVVRRKDTIFSDLDSNSISK